MAGSIKLAPLLTEIKIDIDNFKTDMEKAGALGIREAKRITDQMSRTAKVGDALSKTGSLLTKGLTLPIIGAGTAATKMSIDFESSFAKVSTLLDSSVVDLGKYKEDILNASSESKIAVDEFSEAVYNSISAGVDQTKAIGFTTDAMKLAKGGFTSGAAAVDILTTAINGYNLKAEDASKISDMLIATQNLGKTTVDELASSMGAVIPVANSVNFGIGELSAAYAQLTKNGIATSEAGTYVKSMLSEIGKSGSVADKVLRELTGKGFAQLKQEGTSTSKILQLLNEHAKKNGKSLKDMFGSVEAGSAALVLAKGNGAEYDEMLRSMSASAGATQEAFQKMDATPAERMKGALNELKNESIKLSAQFVPAVEKITDVVKNVSKSFSNLSDEQKDNVLKWGMVLAAAGPVLKVVGGGISTFTKLSSVMSGATKGMKAFGSAQKVTSVAAQGASMAVGHSGLTGSMIGLLGTYAPLAAGAVAVGAGIYAIHESSQLAKRQVNEASEEMSWMERVCARLSGTEVHTREELEKMGYVHKEFSEDISPEFQKAVEVSTKKVERFNVFLREIGFDNVITQEESDAFNNKIMQACDEAIQTIQSKKEKSQSALKELFVADDSVVDEGERKVLDILSQSSDKQVEEISQLKTDIIAIKQKAVDEGRNLNEQEIKDIEEKHARIRQIELESLGGTQSEMAYARNEFRERVKTMDLKAASELMREKAKIRDEEIVKIKASYDTEIEMLRGSLNGKTQEEVKAIMEQVHNLEQDRDNRIKMQKELYDNYFDIIQENNPKLLNGINKYNGEVLTNEDISYQKRIKQLQDTYSDLKHITESGCYEIYNKTTGHSSQVAVKIDETSGEIIGIYDKTTGLTAGYCEDMAKSAVDMANRQDAAFQKVINIEGAYIDETGAVCLANGQRVASLNDLKKATDGTRDGIVKLNGTEYRIKVNKDGTVASLESIGQTADHITRPRKLYVSPVWSGSIETSFQKWSNMQNGRSHYNGLDNVPYDGYRAILHKGERVLTAEENKMYQDAANKDIVNNATIVVEIGGREIKREIVQIANEGLGEMARREMF